MLSAMPLPDHVYEEEPQPALSSPDAAWARKFKPKPADRR
jgi:hypothetical protein